MTAATYPELAGRVAIVTGAGAGIGRATALALAAQCVKVVAVDLSGVEDTAREVAARGAESSAVIADVTREADVRALVDTTLARYGRLDIAFNNAGIEGRMAGLAEQSVEDWARVVGVDLTGVFLCLKYELPPMLAAARGAIVNMSSVAGQVGFPGAAPYVASKHGVIGLTRTAALEYAARGVRVNAVCPGVIRTAMIDRIIAGDPATETRLVAMAPVGRMGRPEEIADAVLWLVSDRASFVTGHALTVDGGLVAA